MGVRLSGLWARQPVPLRMVMAQFWDHSQAMWRQQHPLDTWLGRCINPLDLMPSPGTRPSSRLGRTDRNKSE